MSPPPPASGHRVLRALLLLAGGVTTVLLLVGATALFAAALVHTTARDTTVLEGPVRRVVVDVDGSVQIRPGVDGQSRIERTSSYSFEEPEVRATLAAGTLRLEAGCPQVRIACRHEVVLTVPADVDLDVQADIISVRGVTGRVHADSFGGSVELAGLSGPLEIDVDGGAITGRDLTSRDVRARAGAGSVLLEFAGAPTRVDAAAGAGRVEVVVPRDAEGYRVEVASGDRTVSVAEDPTSERVITARASAGEVVVRYGPL